MSSTNTVQHYVSIGLRGLANVLGAFVHSAPIDAQDKSNMHIGLQDVHDAIDQLAQGAADMPQTGLTKEDVLPDLIRAFAPHIATLVQQEVAKHLGANA